MERCPACRGRLGNMACSRCGCDFTLAIRAETQAQSLVRQAIQAWREGDRERAANRIGASLALKYSRLAEAVAVMLRASERSDRAASVAPATPTGSDIAAQAEEGGRCITASEFYLAGR